MNENELKLLAQQLRKPEGEMGRKTGERMNANNRLMNQQTIEQLNVIPGDNILEIGMGNGYFVKDILSVDASVKYSGCDFSETMIEEAKNINQQFIESGQAAFLLSHAGQLPFKDKTFDKVFTVNTIYFWEDPEKILAEIHRVLQPQGQFIIALRPKAEMETYPFVKYGFNLFSEDDVVELLFNNRYIVTRTIETEEPDMEINGKKVKMKNLIIMAETIS